MKTIHPNQLSETDYTAIVDVRTADEYSRGHIPGSVNIPLDSLQAQADTLRSQERIILSCQSGKRAEQAYHQLVAMGLSPVCLEGSYNGWQQHNLPTQSTQGGISIMRQVQITVGITLLAAWAMPSLHILVLIAGAGLLMAGITNTCMLANILAAMPWNKQQPTATNGQNCCAPNTSSL